MQEKADIRLLGLIILYLELQFYMDTFHDAARMQLFYKCAGRLLDAFLYYPA